MKKGCMRASLATRFGRKSTKVPWGQCASLVHDVMTRCLLLLLLLVLPLGPLILSLSLLLFLALLLRLLLLLFVSLLLALLIFLLSASFWTSPRPASTWYRFSSLIPIVLRLLQSSGWRNREAAGSGQWILILPIIHYLHRHQLVPFLPTKWWLI